jgi:hypothetical protein
MSCRGTREEKRSRGIVRCSASKTIAQNLENRKKLCVPPKRPYFLCHANTALAFGRLSERGGARGANFQQKIMRVFQKVEAKKKIF